jgi:dipeptidyl aminopeptidase/acylaminoacyl peptidase
VVVEADGSGEVQVSRSAATEASEPVWSPDGTRIAFQAFEGDGWDVWVANADGTEQMAVTGGPGDELSPVWSPDGARIAFLTSEEPVEDLDLYVVNPDATGLTKLAEGVPAGGGELSWQPDVGPGLRNRTPCEGTRTPARTRSSSFSNRNEIRISCRGSPTRSREHRLNARSGYRYTRTP